MKMTSKIEIKKSHWYWKFTIQSPCVQALGWRQNAL